VNVDNLTDLHGRREAVSGQPHADSCADQDGNYVGQEEGVQALLREETGVPDPGVADAQNFRLRTSKGEVLRRSLFRTTAEIHAVLAHHRGLILFHNGKVPSLMIQIVCLPVNVDGTPVNRAVRR